MKAGWDGCAGTCEMQGRKMIEQHDLINKLNARLTAETVRADAAVADAIEYGGCMVCKYKGELVTEEGSTCNTCKNLSNLEYDRREAQEGEK